MKIKLPLSNSLLLTFIFLENGSLFYFYKIGFLTQGKNAWSLFLSSVLFGVVLIYKFYNASIVENLVKRKKTDIITYIVLPVIFVSGLVWIGFLYFDLFSKLGIDPSYSDIIPSIQILCKRFLAGQYPYDIVYLCGYAHRVIYLPMHWLPFTIAEKLNIDYRWICFGLWSIAAIYLFVSSLKTQNTYLRILMPLLIVGANLILYFNDPGIIGITIELMVAGYYMLFISGLNQQNTFIQGLFMSFCILSRYSLILWLPLYAFVLLVSKNKKQLFFVSLTVILLSTLIFVIPFLSKDWSILSQGFKTYDSSALYEWGKHLQTKGPDKDKPMMLFSGTGYAYYFYTRFTNLDILARIKICQKVHLTCSILITVIMGIWYWFNKEKINFKIFLLASFKIYLAVFLFLIQVPYPYLMITGNFVSIAIFCEQARYRVKYNQTPKYSSQGIKS